MVSMALEISEKTGGVFDLTIGTRLTELGYGLPDTQLSQAKKGSYRDVILEGNILRLLHGVAIEFG